jgi:molecular chaperone GrpE
VTTRKTISETEEHSVDRSARSQATPQEQVGAPGDNLSQGAPSAEPETPDVEMRLAEVERQRDEYLELAQRVQADFENYRKRAAR